MIRQIYAIVSGKDFNELGTLVNQSLSQGWRCQGGIAVYETVQQDRIPAIYNKRFMQALVMDAKVDDVDD